MFRKSEALHRHHERRVSNMEEVKSSHKTPAANDWDPLSASFLQSFKQEDRLPVSSFPNELLQSEGFAASQGQKSIVTSRLDFTDDDVEAYYQQEGRELFGSTEGAIKYEQQLMSILQQHQADSHAQGSCLVKDYELDGRLSPEEINHKLSFVRVDLKLAPSIDYTQQFPPATAETNYQRLMELKLNQERDAVRDQYWQQGFLGRFLVYLIDRIIQASLTTAQMSVTDKKG